MGKDDTGRMRPYQGPKPWDDTPNDARLLLTWFDHAQDCWRVVETIKSIKGKRNHHFAYDPWGDELLAKPSLHDLLRQRRLKEGAEPDTP